MTNKTVLITGACGDIGRSLALEFARVGASLALCDLMTLEEAAPLLAELRMQSPLVIYRQANVSDPAAVESFVSDAVKDCGGLDICIANAGIVERGLLVELSVEAWRRTLEVNLTGCFLTAQAAARAMLTRVALSTCGRQKSKFLSVTALLSTANVVLLPAPCDSLAQPLPAAGSFVR